AARGAGARVEVQNQVAVLEIGKRDGCAVVARQLEGGSLGPLDWRCPHVPSFRPFSQVNEWLMDTRESAVRSTYLRVKASAAAADSGRRANAAKGRSRGPPVGAWRISNRVRM